MSVPVRIVRRVLSGDLPVAALRPWVEPPNHATPTVGQLNLWVRDADGTPERPWLVTTSTRFDCAPLACRDMRVSVCVARQLTSERQRTRDTWRGQSSDFPSCVTERCAQGRGIREALAKTERRAWIEKSGQPFIASTRRGPLRANEEFRARRRLERVGLLDQVRTIDDVEGDKERGDG